LENNPKAKIIIFSQFRETAVDIIKMDAGLDSGDIVVEEKISLNGQETYADLAPKLAKIGANLMEEVMQKLADGKKLELKKQNHDAAIYAKKIEKSECEVDWNFSAKIIEQKIRGLNGSLGAYFIFNDEKIKIFAAEILRAEENFPAEKIGKLVENRFEIYCQQGILKPLIVQRICVFKVFSLLMSAQGSLSQQRCLGMSIDRKRLEDENRPVTVYVHQLLYLILVKTTAKIALEIGVDDDGK
jgi:hypothetical protein